MFHQKNVKTNIFERLTTAQTLMLGYLIFIITGSVILMLPFSLSGDNSLSLINAIFTTTSAISGTGLIVVDTATHFTLLGQGVIITLIQIGNVGYMLFFAIAVFIIGGRLSFFNRVMLRESISTSRLDLMLFTRKVFKYTFVVETVSAILLTSYWIKDFGFPEALKQGIFHAVSAFCSAGFSTFSNNLMDFHNDYYVNAVIIATSYLGSCGFFVLYDLSRYSKGIFKKRNEYKVSTHTKLVLTVSLTIITTGALFLIFSESINPKNLETNKVLTSIFMSSSAANSVGFNTVSVDALSDSSLFFIIMQMFIGGSPSGTGGGIKTTVFALIILGLFAYALDRKNINVFKRTINPVYVARAFAIMLMSAFSIFICVMILTFTEEQVFLHLLFEAVSAFGNNGISVGFTSEISTAGQLVLSYLMLLGRVGPLIIGYTFASRIKSEFYQYPEGNILIV
jgi:trk system potassium uptake protein TrkH